MSEGREPQKLSCWELEPNWIDQNGATPISERSKLPQIDNNHQSPNDPVFLNGNVFVKGTRRTHYSWNDIWKYSISQNTWSLQPSPLDVPGAQEHVMYKYILTTYQSQLVCIGGYIYNRESCESMKNNKVYALTRDGTT